MSFVDDILDFLAFLLLLGVCTAVAFGVVIPIVSESQNTAATTVSDKSAPEEKGYTNNSGFDGKLSKMEVVLMTQVQSPTPRPLPVDKQVTGKTADYTKYQVKSGSTVEVGESYRSDLMPYAADAYSQMQNDPSNTRYLIDYNYGVTSDESDDFYHMHQ